MDEIERQVWLDERSGHVTASRVKDLFRKGKGKEESAMRRNYMAQLIAERQQKKSLEEDRRSFWDIKRGERLEPIARVEYEMAKGVIVDTAQFVKHPTIPWFGCTPDGYVGKDGLVQFKAPVKGKHMDWVLSGVVPAEHKYQMHAELACCIERQWNDFGSYDEDFEPHLFVVRLKRDEAEIKRIEAEVLKFNAEIEEIMARLSTPLEERLERSLAQAIR